MAQILPRYCSRCGAETAPNQQFCATCGLPTTPRPVDLPPDAFSTPAPAAFFQPSMPAQSAPDIVTFNPGHKRGLTRPMITLLLLLILVILGTASYFGLRAAGVFKTGQPAITTENINSTLTYASVDITVFKVQQSQSFADDPDSASDGMVRLDLRARNTTTMLMALPYASIAHLLLPDRSLVQTAYVNASDSIAAGATQTGTLDFAVPTRFASNQLTLRLGLASEAQMDMPLNGHADLAQYAPRTVTPAQKLEYFGLDYDLTSATTQLSLAGQQASKDMRYVTLTLSVNNSLSQMAIPGPAYSYMRLKSAATMLAPINTTLPVSFDTGVSGKIGTVSFLIPQTPTALALVLAAQNPDGFDQATVDFQL